jgi:hypothetical protein
MPDPESTILEDLLRHPELSPIVDVDSRGNVVCLGWTSPVYEFDKSILEEDGNAI